MRDGRFSRFRAVVAVAATVASLAVACPAHAGQGDPGPGGPTRFDVAFSRGACDYLTGKFVVSLTISQDPAYKNWQYVGVYYQVHQNQNSGWNFYNVSHDTRVTGGWIGPGSAPLHASFSITPPGPGQWLEVDNIDVVPSDGWYTDMSVVTPASCRFLWPFPIPVFLPILSPILGEPAVVGVADVAQPDPANAVASSS